MATTTTDTAWKRVSGRDLLAGDPITGTVFRVPATRAYKGQQPSMTILHVDENVSQVYACVEVLIDGESESQNYTVRYTYEYEIHTPEEVYND